MKQIISLLFTAVILFSLSVTAFAADNAEERELKDYIYIEYTDEEIEEISSRIAAQADYWPVEYSYGYESAWVAIRITAHPEIVNPLVLNATVEKMVERSKACFDHPTDHSLVLNNIRLGGELALHIALVLLFNELDAYKGDPTYDMLYERFDYAEMNIDEHRIPLLFMMATGTVVMRLTP